MKRQVRLAKYEYRRKRKRFMNRLFLFSVIILIAIFTLNKFGIFNVISVKVEGAERLKSTEVIKVSGIKVGQSYFSVSPNSRERDLEKIPLVKSAKISFNFKREAVIKLEERIPKFQIENFLEYYMLDEDMKIISKESSKAEVPEIKDNLKKLNLGEKIYEDDNKIEFFKELVNQPVYSKIEDIDLNGTYSLFTKDGIQIVIGKLENLDYKFRMLEEILKDIEATGKNARIIELDKEDPIVMVDDHNRENIEENLDESQ